MTPKEFNTLRAEFLSGNSTGAKRLEIIKQLNHYQREVVREQDNEAKREAASVIDHASARLTVTGAPDEIWLVYGDLEHDDTHANCYRDGEVSWCEDQQFPSDVRYVRADIAAVAALRLDAERYRYLRNRYGEAVLSGHGPSAGCWIDCEDEEGTLTLLTDREADDAIDMARRLLGPT